MIFMRIVGADVSVKMIGIKVKVTIGEEKIDKK